MPSLKAIRRRVAGFKNTQKITRAMKLISAARLRKAQQAAESTRPFADEILKIIGRIAARVETAVHPLLKPRDVKVINLVVVCSDRGLAGGYNGNVLRTAEAFIKDAERKGQTVHVTAIGKRARDYSKLRKYRLDFITDIGSGLSYGTAELLAERVIPRFLASEPKEDRIETNETQEELEKHLDKELADHAALRGREHEKREKVVPVDSVVIIYTRFKSAISQTVVTQQLLPMDPLQKSTSEEVTRIDYKYEPGQAQMLEALIPRHLKMQLYRALLESTASEHGARMTAMDSASKNAAELIARLTLQMNRARQAMITKELMEIVSGKEALES
jgi:F-type H+-transporting ATPase subunit gamma